MNVLLGGALLLSAPLFTSCQDILGEWDRPTPASGGSGGSSAAEGTYIVYTAPGTSSNVAIPSTATAWNFTSGDVPAGTYYVEGSFTSTGALVLQGEVNLILKDGATLTVDNGIGTAQDGPNYLGSLNIYAQSEGASMGHLIVNNATPTGEATAVAVKEMSIHGGQIDATGTNNSDDLGGKGLEALKGDLVIYAGIINATGCKQQAGIFANEATNGIVINGGTVTAIGGDDTTYPGNGIGGYNAGLIVNGGTVTATGGDGTTDATGVSLTGSGEITLGTGITFYEGDSPNPTTAVATTPITCSKRYVVIK